MIIERDEMISAIESIWPFNGRRTQVGPKLRAYAAAVVAQLRAVAPYALLELILPGGSVMALLLWLYRRQRKVPVFASQGAESFDMRYAIHARIMTARTSTLHSTARIHGKAAGLARSRSGPPNNCGEPTVAGAICVEDGM